MSDGENVLRLLFDPTYKGEGWGIETDTPDIWKELCAKWKKRYEQEHERHRELRVWLLENHREVYEEHYQLLMQKYKIATDGEEDRDANTERK